MNKQEMLNKIIEKHPHPDPEFRALLDKIFKRIGEGKGDYAVDRHKQPMPDIETILKEAQKFEETDTEPQANPKEDQ